MQRPATTDHHHPDDPRSRTRVALEAGDVATAAVWAELATAEAIHRLAKTIGRAFDTPDSNQDAARSGRLTPVKFHAIADAQAVGEPEILPTEIERGRHRRPADQPDSAEQAA